MKRELLLESWTNFKVKLKKALKKPTATEKETQTKLTAEQITQMEQELATKRTELVKLVQDKKEQSEDYQKKEQELTNLQTKYDLTTKTKQQLLDYLNVYRKQTFLEYSDGVLQENKVGIEEFLNQHTGLVYNKVNLLIFKLTSDRVIDFKWIEKIASDFLINIVIRYSRATSPERPAPKITLLNLPKDFVRKPLNGSTYWQFVSGMGKELAAWPELVVKEV